MHIITRRRFLQSASAAAAGLLLSDRLFAQPAPYMRGPLDASIEILHPLNRVPTSFFIDDSTCLVNMGYFCMPQFAEAWPDAKIYKKPWKIWPREIPDAFVREFGQFCADNGVKGKFSLVPYPCCVGRLDRELPGWSRSELLDSLKLVREVMLPNWDIHPEMITHTRVIDLKTGHPFEKISSATMENSYPPSRQSADELAAYLAYALAILKNCDIPCEGITTPGGFGNAAKSELSLATRQAVTDVFGAEIPHYFKYVSEGKTGVEPRLEHVEGADTDHPKLCVSVPAGTGDWFGNWDGDSEPQGPNYASDDGTSGRMVELIERGDPAIMLCHWPGLYCHGSKKGFQQFTSVIRGLHSRFRDRMHWMKISEIARYWAARQLTRIDRRGAQVTLDAPFACPDYTMKISGRVQGQPKLSNGDQTMLLREINDARQLAAGTFIRREGDAIVCINLPKGRWMVSL